MNSEAGEVSAVRPFDLQVNGYVGADFSDPELRLEVCRNACERLAADGVGAILATVITGPLEQMGACLENLRRHREADPLIAKVIAGFHVEGPFLSPLPGYVGAHDATSILPATPEAAARLVDAGGGLVRLMTLAPEGDSRAATTRWLVDQGITVSAGHTDCSLDELSAAIDAGLSMVTHLGNGCPIVLPRHENIIQRLLSRADNLWICFIPDGAHVPWFALKNYLQMVGLERTIMVTDAIAAAGLGPGRYMLAGAEVQVDAEGVARRPGSDNLAGSTITMPRLQHLLQTQLTLSTDEVRRVIEWNPGAALTRERPAPFLPRSLRGTGPGEHAVVRDSRTPL
jgi:N-acetylglucosamine-6-phosphate deacetylase